MNSERWQRVERLFHEALAHDSAERETFLDNACRDEEALRLEVKSLLSFHVESETSFDNPAGELAADLLLGHEFKFESGQRLGSYSIVRPIASGGMGEVYLAEDIRLKREVALKLLPPQFTIDPSRVRRFEHEARAASSLNHPNIVTILEIGCAEATHFIATEFIEGVTLREHLTKTEMTLGEILDVAAQVASALAAAHQAGVVHRDLKPENIMLRRDGLVKMLDFGLAKLTTSKNLDVASSPSAITVFKTDPGTVMGTVQYMSPEQTRGEETDASSDIWSFGVVLYELLTARVPFTGETPSHVIVSILEDNPQQLSDYVNVPVELERIVTQALSKRREERSQNASEIAATLKRLGQELEPEERLKVVKRRTEEIPKPATTTKLAALRSSASYLSDRFKKHRKSAVLSLLIVMVAVSIAAYVLLKRRATGSSQGPIKSIAVLPFANMSQDPDMEYLSDGLSENLLNSISRLPALKVTARQSSFQYKGKEIDPKQIAHDLAVEAILTGHIKKRDGNISINVELIDGAKGTHLWGEQYNRKQSQLPGLEIEISDAIVDALRVHMTLVERQRLNTAQTVNPEAYELLLRSRFYWRKGTTDAQQKGLEYIQRAIQVDPLYALGYAELAGCYSSLINLNLLEPKEYLPKAAAAAKKSLELDESLAEAHLAVSQVKLNAWEWESAESEIRRAIELNPNLARAHATYTFYLMICGRGQQALAEARRARELDPLSTSALMAVVYGLLATGQAEEALKTAERILETDKDNPTLHGLFGQVYGQMGRLNDSLAAYQRAVQLGDTTQDTQVFLGVAYAKTGDARKARAILRRLEHSKEYISPAVVALLYIALGDQEQAFSLLEGAYAAHDQQLIWLGVEGGYSPLHNDPRYESLLRRIGLKS